MKTGLSLVRPFRSRLAGSTRTSGKRRDNGVFTPKSDDAIS